MYIIDQCDDSYSDLILQSPNCYKLDGEDNATWFLSRKKCHESGGVLAMLSWEERDYLVNEGNYDIWIGYYYNKCKLFFKYFYIDSFFNTIISFYYFDSFG